LKQQTSRPQFQQYEDETVVVVTVSRAEVNTDEEIAPPDFSTFVTSSADVAPTLDASADNGTVSSM
jgi:hypothetical protein